MRTHISRAVKKIALGSTLAAIATASYAATDGTTGFTSTGDLDISLTVANEVKISNLADITLPAFSGADVSGTSEACIYRNGGGAYEVTATGSGPGNAFELTDGTNTVAYSVTFDDGTGAAALATGLATGRANAEAINDDCVTAAANNADIEVTVLAAAASALPASVYTGTLTLLVAPI